MKCVEEAESPKMAKSVLGGPQARGGLGASLGPPRPETPFKNPFNGPPRAARGAWAGAAGFDHNVRQGRRGPRPPVRARPRRSFDRDDRAIRKLGELGGETAEQEAAHAARIRGARQRSSAPCGAWRNRALPAPDRPRALRASLSCSPTPQARALAGFSTSFSASSSSTDSGLSTRSMRANSLSP